MKTLQEIIGEVALRQAMGEDGDVVQDLRRLVQEATGKPPEGLEAVGQQGRERPVSKPPRGLSPERLKMLRQELGLTQEELAQKLGVSANSVHAWERGMWRPRPENVKKIRALRQAS